MIKGPEGHSVLHDICKNFKAQCLAPVQKKAASRPSQLCSEHVLRVLVCLIDMLTLMYCFSDALASLPCCNVIFTWLLRLQGVCMVLGSLGVVVPLRDPAPRDTLLWTGCCLLLQPTFQCCHCPDLPHHALRPAGSISISPLCPILLPLGLRPISDLPSPPFLTPPGAPSTPVWLPQWLSVNGRKVRS